MLTCWLIACLSLFKSKIHDTSVSRRAQNIMVSVLGSSTREFQIFNLLYIQVDHKKAKLMGIARTRNEAALNWGLLGPGMKQH